MSGNTNHGPSIKAILKPFCVVFFIFQNLTEIWIGLIFKTFSRCYCETNVKKTTTKQIKIDLLYSHAQREREACLTNIESIGYQAV